MTYVSVPQGQTGSSHNFYDAYYYGTFSTTVGTTYQSPMWQGFLDLFYGSSTSAANIMYTRSDGSQISLSNLLRNNTSSTWPPTELTEYEDHLLIESLFASCLRSFFYDYAPSYASGAGALSSGNITTRFLAYLQDPDTNSASQKQSNILIWIFNMLANMLNSINEATPTEGNYLLAMTKVEVAAATSLSNITYGVQSSSDDYETQTENMENQKQGEVLQAQRSAAGKTGQQAQAVITALRDAGSQQSDLMASVMQSFDTMIQTIVKK